MLGPIVLACDERYAMPLATTLRSVAEANRAWWPLKLFVLAFAVSNTTQEKVVKSLPKGSASIQWLKVNLDMFNDFSTLEHVSKVTYARLLMSRLLPEETTRVLYLDADLLVLADLKSLWEADLDGCVMGAVMDGLDPEIKSGKLGLEKLPRVAWYFNAGVMLIDLVAWRRERISEKALDYLRQYPESPLSDQDALNVACDGVWKMLDERWNVIDHVNHTDILELGAERRPWILHFATWKKPWDYRYPNLNGDYYDSFRSRTLFARTLIEKRRDALREHWTEGKRFLKRAAPIRIVWDYIRG